MCASATVRQGHRPTAAPSDMNDFPVGDFLWDFKCRSIGFGQGRAANAPCEVVSGLLRAGKCAKRLVAKRGLPAVLAGQNVERSFRRAKAKAFHFFSPDHRKKSDSVAGLRTRRGPVQKQPL